MIDTANNVLFVAALLLLLVALYNWVSYLMFSTVGTMADGMMWLAVGIILAVVHFGIDAVT